MERVIVITGASAGIGESLAVLLGSKGDKVVVAARREKELEDVARRAGGGLAVVTDVTKRADVERLAARALERFGKIDAWINNAGRGLSRLPSELTDDDVDTMITDNVKSALYGMQAVLPHFKARGEGHLVNVSSMLGRVPYVPFRSAYVAAKHALNGLTACLRLELREAYPKIVVSTVSPGVVATEFGLNAKNGGFDSRAIPGAQPASEVAEVIAGVLDSRRTDVYTRAELAVNAGKYYQDIEAAEAAMQPFAPPKK
jgi:NAD(P)-dependent dehydrogenase (short-subunit alcohol dehydrogenase family)